MDLEWRGVRTSRGCKEAVIEDVASNMKKEKKETIEM